MYRMKNLQCPCINPGAETSIQNLGAQYKHARWVYFCLLRLRWAEPKTRRAPSWHLSASHPCEARSDSGRGWREPSVAPDGSLLVQGIGLPVGGTSPLESWSPSPRTWILPLDLGAMAASLCLLSVYSFLISFMNIYVKLQNSQEHFNQRTICNLIRDNTNQEVQSTL